MGDIFGYSKNTAKASATFDPVNSILTFEGSGTKGWLIQSWGVQYDQQVNELFEIGSDAVYWVKGRPTGQGSINRAIGMTGSPLMFNGDQYFNICKGGFEMKFTVGSGKCEGGQGEPQKVNITIDGAVVTHIGFTMNAPSGGGGAQALLTEDIQFRFAYMEVN